MHITSFTSVRRYKVPVADSAAVGSVWNWLPSCTLLSRLLAHRLTVVVGWDGDESVGELVSFSYPLKYSYK